MPNQSLLFLEVLERILAYIQLLFRSKGFRIWGVVPGVNVIPSKLHHLQQISSQEMSARRKNKNNKTKTKTIVAPRHIQSGTYLYVLYFCFLLMLLLQVLIYGSQLFNILQTHKSALVLTSTGESWKLKAIHTAAKLTGAV